MIINEANSFTEEVRRTTKDIYGFEKLYSQGLSISTPLRINYQIQALKSLRKGIEDYDRRRGWRGPVTNKIKSKLNKTNMSSGGYFDIKAIQKQKSYTYEEMAINFFMLTI